MSETALPPVPSDRPVALVTGGRRGLGRGIALSLAQAGFDIVLNDVVEDEETYATIKALGAFGISARFLRHDIGDIEGHAAFVRAAAASFGRIDCLVNNAGIQVPRRIGLLEVGAEEFDRVVNINLRGTFFLTQEIARWMRANDGRDRRSIISITSSNASLASTDKAAYCLAKSALSMMTALFALELGDHNIQVYEIRPGLMATDMTAMVREKYANYIAENTLFKRWGEPDDVGRAVAALATGAIPYASGEIINVDGGMHIRRL
ncbi:NAD(P)-dependent dehydrogenase, short-chain alcohol dehydrogenase family [Xaviernesmea oryzae]|uniref:NAD(P)-dependent dehydrogenase, short-chain alcohol dehydrogenase family n=1 Tax=Xaviernesmea oryzae TaxID=464029 RepID=A0A1X7DCK9_9HYPH|nr:3-ketoacyl-ACP reductase [Xaviernesmea oryzae]SMF12951.1 NAD(P)-dependent dehydrogenase, short-chain alcohol dehydrogenase family [Xaviernesmea oryzae]